MSYDMPEFGTIDEWEEYDTNFKKNAPTRHFIMKTIPSMWNKIAWPIAHRYTDIKNWVRFRTYDKYHVLKTGLPPGYNDKPEQMLHVNFNLLVDYVEVELAWLNYITDDSIKRPWWQERNFRDRELGIKHLEWEMTLDDPNLPPHERNMVQARTAKQLKSMYIWWTEVRPNRKELEFKIKRSFELAMIEKYGEMYQLSSKFQEEQKEACKRFADYSADSRAQEDGWRTEDATMLKNLMDVREFLWT